MLLHKCRDFHLKRLGNLLGILLQKGINFNIGFLPVDLFFNGSLNKQKTL